MGSARLRVHSTGWLTTFQDLGRRDAEVLGVPTGGAADQFAAMVANILVGNRREAPLIETMGGVLEISPSVDVLVAFAGAPAQTTIGGVPTRSWTPVVVPAGTRLRIANPPLGSRTYLAIQGELVADRFLGSVAPDARMGFGQVIAADSSVELQTHFTTLEMGAFPTEFFRLPVPVRQFAKGPWTIDVVRTSEGERSAWLHDLIESSEYTVTDRSNHVGLRLEGPIRHPGGEEIVSHGVPIGALEVTHSDELIVLGRYRTLTAGYPIVGVATTDSLSLLGQAGPGRTLRFRWVERQQAVAAPKSSSAALDHLQRAVQASAVISAVASRGGPPSRHHVANPAPRP